MMQNIAGYARGRSLRHRRQLSPARRQSRKSADGGGRQGGCLWAGLAQVAPALFASGCRFFYVAHIEEGIALRAALPEAEIAVLHGIPAKEAELAKQYRLIPVLCDIGSIQEWSKLARGLGHTLPVIIHLDTGMNRLGLPSQETAQLIEHPEWLTGLKIHFWLSHLACADAPKHGLNRQQLTGLQGALGKLPPAPVSFANSSGIFLGADYHYDQVRPAARFTASTRRRTYPTQCARRCG